MNLGYNEHRKSFFRISTLDAELVLVSDRIKVLEYLAAPEDIADAYKGQDNVCWPAFVRPDQPVNSG
jgi:hypothetical protein